MVSDQKCRLFINRLILMLLIFNYISFLLLDIITKDRGNPYSILIKYTSIILCFILSMLINGNGHGKTDTLLLQAALFFTVLADLNLVILSRYEIGVVLFCIVQSIYILRHNNRNIKKVYTYLPIAILYIIALLYFVSNAKLITEDRSLIVISLIYAILLFSSLYSAWRNINNPFYPRISRYMIAVGLTLFFFCDINVALNNLLIYYKIDNEILTNTSDFLIWFFYLPSQTLLALSGFNLKYLMKIKPLT